jgi:hypothetical protein
MVDQTMANGKWGVVHMADHPWRGLRASLSCVAGPLLKRKAVMEDVQSPPPFMLALVSLFR